MPTSATAVLRAAPVAALLLAAPALAQPTLDGCPVLPRNNVWNTPVDALPVAANSAAVIQYIDAHGATHLHPDFGSGTWQGAPIGIPYVAVPDAQAMVPIDFSLYGWPDESDPGPYPVPANAPIEGGPSSEGDRHVLVVRQGSCILYELYYSWPNGTGPSGGPTCVEPGGWCGASGAVYDLHSNAFRPDGWTSADAAGLPILPGLARYPEAAAGEIRHALRFTVSVSRRSYVWPARHQAGSTNDAAAPPMGLRVRLRADFDLSGFSPQTRILLLAMRKYGLILADNGSNWFVSGIPDAGWDDNQLVGELAQVPGSAFEVVDVSSIRLNPDSGATPHVFSDGFESGGMGRWTVSP
jgi:hypothetical protein